ncbi:GDP-mannose 4,6-dehydratase [Candidatus Marinamargulisbacteria bacterium SCGC AAA071-K20]|nr:GDP-mannose 4,6-dehydratase [Candidatus Marinamargulisbacteria bacterium SCGC AAA071-K20]
MKKALITGISGQDGSYLAELLLQKGYKVYGMARHVALDSTDIRFSRINHILDDIEMVYGSLESYPSVYTTINKIKPDEIYHLGAQSFVSYSFDDEFSTMNSNINGTHYLLSAMRDIVPEAHFYFAASSEMFGKVHEMPQTEETKFHPRSIYGISKVAGYDMTKLYREAYDMNTCNGILYNHESPRRGQQFVTRKITNGVAKIKHGLTKVLELGNLDAKRDWGHAKDYVEAMWLMNSKDIADDFVICTGETHSVRKFCEIAFSMAGLNYEDHVKVNPKFYRPAEVDILLGDCSKAKKELGWNPKTSFKALVEEMVATDLKEVERNILNLKAMHNVT